MKKQKILIVDDSEMNRALLSDILEDQYDITEAEDGAQAVEILAEDETEFWFVLLDIMMPKMNGFEVLEYINKHYWGDRVVVLMISSDGSPENINRAYSLGAFDYIGRPFDPMIVRKRIVNTLLLYARQHDLEKAIEEQFYEQQKNNDLMISILSHIVEFRNGESGVHVQHVKLITELLLRQVVQLTDQYSLSEADIMLISMASAIHDVGKISIPEEILNKPGKLTAEEFEIMKTHSEIGARMLSDLPIEQFNSPLAKVAYEICRWHHERYDGRGYPDGLKGEEIPIAAQVVALADVYDALTSERCYKKAYSHEEALSMILEGKCGAFNPLLLQCLRTNSDRLKSLCTSTAWGQDTGELRGVKGKGNGSRLLHEKRQDTPLKQPEYMQLLYVDSLTGAYNRRYYEEYIQAVPDMEAAALIDVSQLEQVNKDYGRDVGNLVLQRTAQALLSRIRRNDHLIRYGGDEFLLVFTSMEQEAFEARLEEIKKYFDSLTIDGYPQLHLAVNVGGAYGTEKMELLFHMADDMLKQARHTEERVMVWFAGENADRMQNSEGEDIRG